MRAEITPAPLLTTGARARVTFAGRTVEATVALASPNGRSLFLTFDAMLGGYVGGMPLLWDGAHFRELGREGRVAQLELEP
jgi:hypothetical protein